MFQILHSTQEFKVSHHNEYPFSTDLFLDVMKLLLKLLQVCWGHVPCAIVHEGAGGAGHHHTCCCWPRHHYVTCCVVVVGAWSSSCSNSSTHTCTAAATTAAAVAVAVGMGSPRQDRSWSWKPTGTTLGSYIIGNYCTCWRLYSLTCFHGGSTLSIKFLRNCTSEYDSDVLLHY